MKNPKKNLTRWIAGLMAMLLLLAVTACNSQPDPESSIGGDSSTTTTTATTTDGQDVTEPSGTDSTTASTDSTSGSGGSATDPSKTNKPDDSTTTKKPTASRTQMTVVIENTESDDKVIDMKGYEFVLGSVYMPTKPNKLSDQSVKDFFAMLDEVGKKFNCKISVKNITFSTEFLAPKILAGDMVCNLLTQTCEGWPSNAAAGYIQPMDKIKGIDIRDDRWVKSYTDYATFGGHVWGLQFTRPAEVRACLFYNRTLIKKYVGANEDPYTYVKSKKWTFDKFRQMASACTVDTNQDGTTDIYGVLANSLVDAAYFLIGANGGTLITDNGDGTVTPSYTDKPVQEALELYYDLANVDKSLKVWDYARSVETWNDNISANEVQKFFTEGKAAFYIGESWLAPQVLKKAESTLDYGMVPLPMGPSASRYSSPSMFGSVWTITKNCTGKDLTNTVKIFNAMAEYFNEEEGDDWWLEDLQEDYFRDDDKTSLEMYKLCMQGMTPDFSCAAPTLRGEFGMGALADAIFFRQNTIAQYLSSIKGNYDSLIRATFTQRQAYE